MAIILLDAAAIIMIIIITQRNKTDVSECNFGDLTNKRLLNGKEKNTRTCNLLVVQILFQ